MSDEGGLSPEVAGRVYDRIGWLQDTQAPIERPALDRLIDLGCFDVATSVFELGCGTGKLADRLLTGHLPATSSYLAVDVSNRMVEISRKRIARFADRAQVLHTDGEPPLPAATQSADRFVAAYVFDLLPHEYAAKLIDEAHRILTPGGLLCLASLTYGHSTVARLVSRAWTGIWRTTPRLVGGCRPIEVRGQLQSQNWEIQTDIVIEAWGVPSQVVVAGAR